MNDLNNKSAEQTQNIKNLMSALSDAIGENDVCLPATSQEKARIKRLIDSNNHAHTKMVGFKDEVREFINNDDSLMNPNNFHAVEFDVFCQVLQETAIFYSFELGGIKLHYGSYEGNPIWLGDNPAGLYPIWIKSAQ